MYFIHVPKRGGTTLRLLLELQLDEKEIYPVRNYASVKSPVKEELVSGHFPYWFCSTLDKDFEESFKVTILRDPVERYLSFLRAKKKANVQHVDLESVFNLRLVSNNVYGGDLIDNALCRYLSSDPFLEGESLLESAKKNLEKFDYIVFFDSFASDVIELFQCLGICLDKESIPKINVTNKEPISLELLEKVQKIHQLDLQLYEYAKNHRIKKHTSYPLRTDSFEKIIKKTSLVDYTFDLPLYGRGWTYRDRLDAQEAKYSVYRWVMNTPADIYFPLEEGLEYQLLFYAKPLTKEVFPKVSIEGKEIPIQKINNESFSLYQGIIPKEYITKHPTKLSFYSLKAFEYRDIYPSQYNRNHPPLAFAVNRIRIFETQ